MIIACVLLACCQYGAEKDTEFINGSNFNLKELNQIQYKRLYELGKVWGFLKYHHPSVINGDFNWDNELFRMLHSINDNDFDLTIWIENLGEVTPFRGEKTEDKVIIQSDNDWLKDSSLLSKSLSQLLEKILNAKRSDKGYYIDFTKAGNAVFKNEGAYENMNWNDTGLKLLALFKYWAAVEYFYPHKHLIRKDWDLVLKDYIIRLVESNGELEYKLIMCELFTELKDSHGFLMNDKTVSEYFGKRVAPIEVWMVENKVVITRLFDEDSSAGIEIGDIVLNIDGVAIDTVLKEKLKYSSGSNIETEYRNASRLLFRTNNDQIQVTIERNSEELIKQIETVSLNQVNFYKKNIPSYQDLSEDIVYVYPASLKKDEIIDIAEYIENKKGVVMDFRCYPSDFIVYKFGAFLMSESKLFGHSVTGSLERPGEFSFNKSFKIGEKNKDAFKGKLALLINERTQSQAEFTVQAFRQFSNSIVIGSNTAGADGNVSLITLPGNVKTMITGTGIYTYDWKETQQIGIVPDMKVTPTIKDIRLGKDLLLEKAIEYITK